MAALNSTDELCIFREQLFQDITQQPFWFRSLFALLMVCIFIIGMSGNLLTCVVIYCDRSMHTATNYYLLNLAISDLIVAFGIPLDLSAFFDYSYIYHEFGNTACRAHFFLVIALWNNGILIMTALAIERYIAIWHPLLLNRRPVWRRVMKIIYVIWTVAILETLPEIWTVRLIYTKSYPMCFIVPSTFSKLLNVILGLVTFVIPLGIMLFVYTMVAFKVNVTQKSNSQDKIFNHRNNRSKVNKLVALTLSFLVCWLPFFMLRVLIVVLDWCRTSWFIENMGVLLLLSSLNCWFSIVLNPLLFSLMSTKFRKALKKSEMTTTPRPETL